MEVCFRVLGKVKGCWQKAVRLSLTSDHQNSLARKSALPAMKIEAVEDAGPEAVWLDCLSR